MGAENSVLEGCEWGEPLNCPPKCPWEITPVTKPDGTPATVFEPKNGDTKDTAMLRKNAATLRGLRHPNIVRFIGCGDTSDCFWLATEPVSPLTTAVTDMSSQELSLGLYDLLQGLDFMHSKLGICHNNICLSSIYVSTDGTWKLGGMEHACRYATATQEYLDQCRAFRHEDSLSPEEKTNNIKNDRAVGHARDIFAFGALVDAVLDMVKEKDDITKNLEQQLSACVSADPAARPTASTLLGLSVFRSDLVQILTFLRNIAVKNDSEKKEFFSNLMPRLHSLPETTVARRLVVPLLARFVLLNEWADKLVLPDLLMPKSGSSAHKAHSSVQGLLSESLYRQYVVNHLYNIFHVHDCHIRLVLLEHFSHYVHLFSRQQLEDDIFLQVLLGVRDADDRVVAASLRALADMVPILGGDFVIGGSRKAFFFHGLPKQVSPQDLQKMDSPRNMTSVLSSHKPLLKDLAAGRTGNNVAPTDKMSTERERKAKEREQRREEARLKREERRKKFKEKQLEENEVESLKESDDPKVLGLTIEQVADFDDEVSMLKSGTLKLDLDIEGNESRESINTNGNNGLDLDKNNLDLDKDDLDDSDWEDSEQRISDEIEKELQGMSGSVNNESKVQTSPSPYRSQMAPSPPPIKVDWSDVPEADRGLDSVSVIEGGRRLSSGSESHGFGGPLHLGAKTKSKTGQTVDNPTVDNHDLETNFSDDWGTDDWSSPAVGDQHSSPNHIKQSPKSGQATSPVGNRSLKLKKTTSKTPPKKSAVMKQTDDFGAGLDIKSIEITAKSVMPELDFFADMTPSLPKTKANDLMSLLESSASEQASIKVTAEPSAFSQINSSMSSATVVSATAVGEDEAVPKTNSKLFAVMTAPEEESKGWGDDDDLDWGNEDF